MRFITAAIALFASVALAEQNNAINIPSGQSTLAVTAGQPVTITWSNPSNGTVTIKLQQGSNITPESGIVLASNIPASAETATFTIDPDQVNSHQYTIEIVDNTNPDNYNFSPSFGIANAQSTATGIVSSSASASASTASGTSTVNGTSTASGLTTVTTGSSSTASQTGSSTSGSSSGTASSSATSSGSSSSASASTTTSGSSSSSSSSSSAASTTTPPDSNSGAADLKIQGSLVALVAVAVAVL